MKYRKKPVEIEAVQWIGDNLEEVLKLETPGGRKVMKVLTTDVLIIPTLEGEMAANRFDYIIKGVKGELYPCKPDIFALTYEAV